MSYQHEAKSWIMQNKMINRVNSFLDFLNIEDRIDR